MSWLYLSIGCLTTSELNENYARLSRVLNSLDQKNKQNIGLFQEKVNILVVEFGRRVTGRIEKMLYKRFASRFIKIWVLGRNKNYVLFKLSPLKASYVYKEVK